MENHEESNLNNIMALHEKSSSLLLITSKFLIIIIIIVLISMVSSTTAHRTIYTNPPKLVKLTDAFDRIPILEGYHVQYGAQNVHLKNHSSYTNFALTKSTGSGFNSKDKYFYGFFNAALKLPAGISSGIVVAFYLSNEDDYPGDHDEIDIELLGHEKKKEWVLQTNLYGNGSVKKIGREEKFYLWFDPSHAFHDYTILWNHHHIVFFVDNVPLREVVRNAVTSKVYPSEPMNVKVTIWDGSTWATNGGKSPVNYHYSPFVVSVRGVEMEGCKSKGKHGIVWGPSHCVRRSTTKLDPIKGEGFLKLSQQQRMGLNWARKKFMFYSYCTDKPRYKFMPPECTIH